MEFLKGIYVESDGTVVTSNYVGSAADGMSRVILGNGPFGNFVAPVRLLDASPTVPPDPPSAYSVRWDLKRGPPRPS
jgi:hypothetical protein